MWHEGVIGIPAADGKQVAVKYWVKAFDEPSEDYGIEGGRISKMSLKVNGNWTLNYDRGWDQKPEDEASRMALQILMKEYN